MSYLDEYDDADAYELAEREAIAGDADQAKPAAEAVAAIGAGPVADALPYRPQWCSGVDGLTTCHGKLESTAEREAGLCQWCARRMLERRQRARAARGEMPSRR